MVSDSWSGYCCKGGALLATAGAWGVCGEIWSDTDAHKRTNNRYSGLDQTIGIQLLHGQLSRLKKSHSAIRPAFIELLQLLPSYIWSKQLSWLR